MNESGGKESKSLLRSLEQGSPRQWPEPWNRGANLPNAVRPDVDSAVLAEIRKAEARLQSKNRRNTWLAAAALVPLALGLTIFVIRKNQSSTGVNVSASLGKNIPIGLMDSESRLDLKQGDAVQLEIVAIGKGLVIVGPADIQILKIDNEVQFLVKQGRVTLMSKPESGGSNMAFLVGNTRLVPIGTAGLLDVNGNSASLTVTEGAFEAQYGDGRSPERIESGKTWSYAEGQTQIKPADPADSSRVANLQTSWREGKSALDPSILTPVKPTQVEALQQIRKTYGSIQRVELKDGGVILGYVDVITRDSITIVVPDGRITVQRSNVLSMKEE